MSVRSTMPPLFSLLFVSLSSPFNLLSSFSPSSDLSLTPPCSYIPRPGGATGTRLTGGPWHGERPHIRTHQWEKKTARISPLDVYSDRIQHIATRDPENMSHAIPEGVYLTLLETQTDTDSHTPCSVCDGQCVFMPFVSPPRALGGCPVSEPLVWPPRVRDTILLASWLHQAPVWTPFKHT